MYAFISDMAPSLAEQSPAALPAARPQRKPRAFRDRAKRNISEANADQQPLTAAPARPAMNAGAFGSQGLPPGVRSLPSALTRAIPAATSADPIWQSLPVGAQRPFTLAVQVGGEGHIESAEIQGSRPGSIPTQFEHLQQRVIALLGAGSFALQNNSQTGRELFRISITLSQRTVPDDGAPAELVERGFEPPRAGQAGRAYFTLPSGRHFEAKVEVLSSPARAARP